MQSENALLDLRLGILRVIADVWDDDAKNASLNLRNKLTASGEVDQQKAVKLSVDELIQYAGSPPVAKHGKKYKFESIDSLAVRFIGAAAAPTEWDRYQQVWKKSKDEAIVICLPTPDPDWSDTDKAIKLFEYYEKFPHIYSQDEPSASYNPALFIESFNTAQISTDDFDLGLDEGSFFSFGALLIKLIARAWEDDDFKKYITWDEVYDRTKNQTYSLKIYRALLKEFNYKIPWALRLRFVFSDAPIAAGADLPDPRASYPSKVPYWDKDKNLLYDGINKPVRTLVEIELPKKPDNSKNIAFALAAYNTVGPIYPFTCS
ncbi:MAG: hypothetical protein EOP48_06895 [Sphingobacteriales bacterium]|jgi:ribosomally synthesized peptide (two-chain TOMM family)|nr:MAG: hypothetical protein EOP48_06895 [Sphingobacteriales bacterium]